ncbi:MAG: hypothetical protein FWC69_01180 [Defluviitaleaceae bacterium]|nr:hypothetical protein [Defluviitaleaceae bacterium]
MKNWGKLAYPKFLENDIASVESKDGQVLWKGPCYFAWGLRKDVDKNATGSNIAGRATSNDEDLGDIVKNHNPLDFLFSISLKGGRSKDFVIQEVHTRANPDGSFHHISFNLIDAAG